MARHDTSAIWIARAKVLLPAVALALLSSMFLFAGKPTNNIPPRPLDEPAARHPQAQYLSMSGTTADGAEFIISAEQTTLERVQIMLKNIDITFAMDTNTIAIQAESGSTSIDLNYTELLGHVQITASNGIDLTTGQIIVDQKTGTIDAPEELTARAPFGQLSAQSAQITPASQKFSFRGQVHMVYDMQANSGDE